MDPLSVVGALSTSIAASDSVIKLIKLRQEDSQGPREILENAAAQVEIIGSLLERLSAYIQSNPNTLTERGIRMLELTKEQFRSSTVMIEGLMSKSARGNKSTRALFWTVKEPKLSQEIERLRTVQVSLTNIMALVTYASQNICEGIEL